MLTDGSGHGYTWNAESLLKSTGSVSYTYDGDGKRVEKSSGTYYWFSPGGVPLAETNSGGSTQNEYIYFSGGRTARRDSAGNVYYFFSDQIGTTQLIFNATSGAMCYDSDNTPFGYEMEYTTTCAQEYEFAGMELDSETGNYHTWFRNYEPNLGRWMSPDPLAGNVTNPQSLNRYAYVLNNPTGLVDPLGLGCKPGTANCKQPPECYGMVCADQYYGGEMFKGFTTFDMPICVINGVMGYCNQGALASFMSPTGSDEFDALDPLSGVYIYPAGLPTIAPNGEMVVGTGTPGFNDQVWSEANGTSNVLEFTGSAGPKAVFNNAQQLEALFTGDYLFAPSTPSATQQSPGVSAFASVQQWIDTGYIYITNPLAPGNPPIVISYPIFEQQWVTLPGLWFSGP